MTTRWPRPSAGLALASSLIATATLTGTPGFARQTQGQPNVADVEVRVWPVQGNVYLAVGGFVNAAFTVGDDGVLVVDTLAEPLADKIIAEIRKLAGDKPIRYIVNTHVHPDHTGGNVKVAAAGQSIVGGNFAGQVGADAANAAIICARERAEPDERADRRGSRRSPFAAWPTDTFFTAEKELFFNGEAVQVMHQPAAHTDGDSIVFFRKSDVVVAGDVFVTTTFPSSTWRRAAASTAYRRAEPHHRPHGAEGQAGGRHLRDSRPRPPDRRGRRRRLPRHGDDHPRPDPGCDQEGHDARAGEGGAPVARLRGPLRRARTGFWTTDAFVEAAYRSLSQRRP